ncbi:Phosphoadenosine phosphosulfate sulfurtransferase OS=Lysinibacillus sphaericus OX=1421 GN=LS41612_16105 PE=4 SV=1 [Lysinibacillus sphaericus]
MNLYRILDPQIWVKLVGRVQGANFTQIYAKTKAMGYRTVTLPEGHTWKSYIAIFIADFAYNYGIIILRNLINPLNFGIQLVVDSEETIRELEENGYKIKRNGVSNYTTFKNSRIIFLQKIPDDTDDIKSTKDIPSWKRMCFCILKNDHICRFMGYGLTRQQQSQLDYIKKKYRSLEDMDSEE